MRSSRLHVLRLDRLARRPRGASVHITEQLRLEEALFRADDRNWCIINTGGGGVAGEKAPTVVLGISGKPAKMTNTSRVRREKIPLFRRFTGGGTVVVDDGTTFVSLICNKGAEPMHGGAASGPRELMRWSAGLYARALARCGLQIAHNFDENYQIAVNDQKTAPDSCDGVMPFALRENDYVLGDKKFAGNAQGLSRDRFVHHTSILWEFDPDTMAILSNPEKQPDYRRRRNHDEFLLKLCDVLPSRDVLPNAIINELDAMGFEPTEVDADDPYLYEALSRKHHKSSCHVNADNEKLDAIPENDKWK